MNALFTTLFPLGIGHKITTHSNPSQWVKKRLIFAIHNQHSKWKPNLACNDQNSHEGLYGMFDKSQLKHEPQQNQVLTSNSNLSIKI